MVASPSRFVATSRFPTLLANHLDRLPEKIRASIDVLPLPALAPDELRESGIPNREILAAVTGGFVAMCLALKVMRDTKRLRRPPLQGMLAAISVGVVNGEPLLDLDYVEDSAADVDMNIVRTDGGKYVEIQGTAETAPYGREQLDALLAAADVGIDRLIALQRRSLGELLEPLLGQGALHQTHHAAQHRGIEGVVVRRERRDLHVVLGMLGVERRRLLLGRSLQRWLSLRQQLHGRGRRPHHGMEMALWRRPALA